jgi:predicted acylesterase/phospholipase RssA
MTEKFQTGGFSLVLSGGGALGIAHLEVLHDVEQQALVPGEIVGTSWDILNAEGEVSAKMGQIDALKAAPDFQVFEKRTP